MARKTSLFLILILPIILILFLIPSVKGSRFADQISKTTVVNLKTTVLDSSCDCEPTYGFLPCTSSLWEMVFMIVVYEVLLSIGEQYIKAGSNLFFETFGTGFFGASIFHLLGTVPQVGLILMSGISASPDSMGEELEMSMGLLAGTTIISLTLIWGSVIAFGNYDLSLSPNNSPLEDHHSKPFTLTGYGVTTDIETNVTARLILVSLVPFIILQLSKVHNSSFWIRLIVLVSLIVSVIFLVLYCIYQMFEPWMQTRRLEFVLRKYIRKNLVQSLLTPRGRPNIPVIKEIFHRIDENGNSYISTAELKTLILGIQIEHSGLDEQDFVTKVLKEFDISGDSQINEAEFINGLSNWLISSNKDAFKFVSQAKQKFLNIISEKSTIEEEQSLLVAPNKTATTTTTTKATNATEKVWLKYIKAALFILFGISITFLLAEPLMSTVQEFSTAANIPSFLGSYVMIPLALTFSQAISAISSAKHKTENAISLTLSEIYNGVFLNNMMGLIIVLGLIYCRNLSWDVSTQVLVVLIICAIMGLYTTFCSIFPLWTSILAFALYPLSLLSIYFLTSILGWS
ncbi:sodium/calcium exchanger NCL2-like [Humulus lupulus]|uniref:sodium/calcium exchanger NCL2-like n=1 Tax=Humulus lupulus TaxID=3486 RepID=UPI002B409050|nr:sodium/calcium exchanger NCL2-like [Humulus lupulus]